MLVFIWLICLFVLNNDLLFNWLSSVNMHCSTLIGKELVFAAEQLMMTTLLPMRLRYSIPLGNILSMLLKMLPMNVCVHLSSDFTPYERMYSFEFWFYTPSGAVHFIASNNDSGVRDYDMERFQLCKYFQFEWPVNVSYFGFFYLVLCLEQCIGGITTVESYTLFCSHVIKTNIYNFYYLEIGITVSVTAKVAGFRNWTDIVRFNAIESLRHLEIYNTLSTSTTVHFQQKSVCSARSHSPSNSTWTRRPMKESTAHKRWLPGSSSVTYPGDGLSVSLIRRPTSPEHQLCSCHGLRNMHRGMEHCPSDSFCSETPGSID